MSTVVALKNIVRVGLPEQSKLLDLPLTSKSIQLYSELFKPNNSKLVQLTEQMIQTNEVKTPKKFMFTFDSKKPFPINIDVLIEMKVYDTKGHCKIKLQENFSLDTDYTTQNLTLEKNTHGGNKNMENIMLTLDCFRSMYINRSSNKSERQVQLRLKGELGGETEVGTAVGRIDLLTDSTLIEIKRG